MKLNESFDSPIFDDSLLVVSEFNYKFYGPKAYWTINLWIKLNFLRVWDKLIVLFNYIFQSSYINSDYGVLYLNCFKNWVIFVWRNILSILLQLLCGSSANIQFPSQQTKQCEPNLTLSSFVALLLILLWI